MAMENPFEGKEVWFGVGSQDLYGEEALRQVAEQSGEIVDALNATGKIPVKVVLKPTLKSSDGVKAFMVEASANPNVIGVITWCHTFSPAKMWIRGLEVLTKPLLQLNTQHHFEIPWETIDMDFMNLNQAAHGDREFGYILTRLGINRKIVVGHYTDPAVAEEIGTWARACAGWDASNNMKVMRWGDNMRNVAVTEGDKTEAERVFGASINTWAVNELVAAYEAVKDDQVKSIIEDYKVKYDVDPALLDAKYDSLFIAAKEEAAMVNMMRANGCTAGVTTSKTWVLSRSCRAWPAALPVRVRLRLLRRRRLEDRSARAHRRSDGLRPRRWRFPHGRLLLQLHPGQRDDHGLPHARSLPVRRHHRQAEAGNPPARHRWQGRSGASGLHCRPEEGRRRRVHV